MIELYQISLHHEYNINKYLEQYLIETKVVIFIIIRIDSTMLSTIQVYVLGM